MLNSLVVIVSEAALALYPILIKTVPVGLPTQLLSRFLTFVVCAWALAPAGSLGRLWSSAHIGRTAGLGLITLAHVFTSYVAFSQLPAGVSMSLFYTYPVWNLLGGYLGFGETITVFQAALVALAILGVVLLAIGTQEDDLSGETEKKQIAWSGILAGLAAALTESAMYFAVRTARVENPYTSTLELYSGALLGMLGISVAGFMGGVKGLSLEGGIGSWTKMLTFNSVIGFVGYAMRFFAIPKMSNVAFSLLSLVGVIMSFVWGLLFISEVPNTLSIGGAALIAIAAMFTDQKE